MISLTELITEASLLLTQISNHPDYRALVDKGYYPDLTLGDAQTALIYLTWEINPHLFQVPEVPETEVNHDSRA